MTNFFRNSSFSLKKIKCYPFISASSVSFFHEKWQMKDIFQSYFTIFGRVFIFDLINTNATQQNWIFSLYFYEWHAINISIEYVMCEKKNYMRKIHTQKTVGRSLFYSPFVVARWNFRVWYCWCCCSFSCYYSSHYRQNVSPAQLKGHLCALFSSPTTRTNMNYSVYMKFFCHNSVVLSRFTRTWW